MLRVPDQVSEWMGLQAGSALIDRADEVESSHNACAQQSRIRDDVTVHAIKDYAAGAYLDKSRGADGWL